MNVLILGNGFDIAHGLPTTYADFLRFTKVFKKYRAFGIVNQELILESSHVDQEDEQIVLSIKDICKEAKRYEELEQLITGNVWINHFESVQIKSGWIDFEQEISKIIQVLDQIRTKTEQAKRATNTYYDLSDYELYTMRSIVSDIKGYVKEEDIEKIKNKLLGDLDKLTRCLEIYLSEYINNMEITKKISCIESISIQRVLSFNYTNTYERVYCNGNTTGIEFDYIHGKALGESSVSTCNMIIGIDEYLNAERKDSDNEFIQFKKFYQRIYKRTGNKYMAWLERRNAQRTMPTPPEFNVYIYGHSLDVTDKDILKRIIEAPKSKVTIFFHNQEAFGKQIVNLVKIIGQDELISRTGGGNPSIFFVNATEE